MRAKLITLCSQEARDNMTEFGGERAGDLERIVYGSDPSANEIEEYLELPQSRRAGPQSVVVLEMP